MLDVNLERNPALGLVELFHFDHKVMSSSEEIPPYNISFGCSAGRGGREYQEDRLSVHQNWNGCQALYFSVFDGHGGNRVSDYLAKNFHKTLAQHAKLQSMPIAAFQEVWGRTDDQCYQILNKIQSDNTSSAFPIDGSTATVCIIVGSDLYLMNCGDSAAYSVMADGGAERLTEDHGTNNESEVQRCRTGGGKIESVKPGYKFSLCRCCCSMQADIKPRVYPGGLLVTRSFGDFYAKKEFLGGRPGVIIPNHGNIGYINLKKSSIKFLVLASDGVWDVLTIAEVINIVNQELWPSVEPHATKASKAVTKQTVIPTSEDATQAPSR